MSGMDGVKVHVAGGPRGAADAGNDDGFILVQPLSVNGPQDGCQKNAVAAAGAPDVRQRGLAQVFLNVCH